MSITTASQVKSSQVKSSQRYLLQQDNYHTCSNIRGWNPFEFICLMNYQHSSTENDLIFGDNNVSTNASTRAERSLNGHRGGHWGGHGTVTAASSCTKSFHVENIQCSQWQQGRPHDDHSAPVNNNDAKHSVHITLENMPHVYQCSL